MSRLSTLHFCVFFAICICFVLLKLTSCNLAKVGGRNTVLVDAVSRRIPLVTDRPTIIFGADVTHPHPGEDSSPSIAAVSRVTTYSLPLMLNYLFLS
jgi:hypothetical protein